MRLIDKETSLISEIIAGFLISQAENIELNYNSVFWRSNPPRICPDGKIIRELASSPSDSLKKSWEKHFLSSRDVQLLRLESAKNECITITSALTALTIAVYNFFKINGVESSDYTSKTDPVFDYSLQLCQTIPKAETIIEGTLYDSLIQPCCKLWRTISTDLKTENRLLLALLRLNPFSELKNLDLALPAPLVHLAGDYLVHWQESPENPDHFEPSQDCGIKDQAWWLQVEDFMNNSPLKRSLRDYWLSLPENSLSCTGLGILLEELRRRGSEQNRRAILEFYEAYDFIGRQQIEKDGSSGGYRRLTIIRHLLESKNLAHNRTGNEYFLKFRALLEIIAAERSIPREFRHLSREFCLQQLAPLASLATVTGGERTVSAPSFGTTQFTDHP